MPLPAIVVSIIISVAITAVMTGISLALSYLNKPKTKKSIFDSHTYHENGMVNSIQPGTPKNIIYGEHRIAPAIINKYSYATSDENGEDNHTKTEILCSLGEETTGVWGIRVNDQGVRAAYPNNKGLKMWWCPGGRTNQLVYESRSVKKGALTSSVAAGYNKNIDFDYDGGNNKDPFQGISDSDSMYASASLPGYVLIYEEDNKDSYEVVRYEGLQANGGGWRLTGCRVVKAHVNGSKISQEWQLAYKDDGTTPLTIIPPFGKSVTEQRDLNDGNGTLIDYDDNWSSTVTTNNKVRSFAVTMGWERGLYGLDPKEGYEKKTCKYRIRWRKQGESTWNENYSYSTKTLHDTADSGLYLIVENKAKYAYVVNSDGSYYTDFKGNFGTHGLDFKVVSGLKKTRRYKLNFTTNKEGSAHNWSLPKQEGKSIDFEYEKDSDQQYENSSNGLYEYKYRCKIKFDTGKEKYTGNTRGTTNPVSFTITYELGTATNVFENEAAPGKAVLSSYRLTHHLPEKEPLDYAKYEIQVRKYTADIDNSEDGQNEMRWMTLQEMDNDALEYPYESTLGFRLKMNEKVNTSIESVTCMTQGKAVIDVQNASNVWAASTSYSQGAFIRPTVHNGMYYRCRTGGISGGSEPTWLDIGTVSDGSVTWEIANRYSDNPLDVSADIIMSKRYGRGKYLELTNDRITAFYDKFGTEAAFADETITENGKARKRFSLNFNLDFRGPLIDLLQSLGNTFRGKFYFDGEIPVCFVDRKKDPTAMFCMANIVEDSYKPEALSLTDNINRLHAQYLNRDKNYVQDTDEADIISVNSSWAVSRLQDKTISLYGLTKKWYVRKIINYMLRFAWYTRNSTSFQTTLDGLSCDIGDTFYCHDDTMNLTAQSGRIMAVGANYIDLDKSFTFVVATTYKALLRKDNGQPHSELTVDLTATGTGARTRVYFTSSISSVSANSVYILGTGTYYMKFRCVQKSFRGNTIEIGALEYNDEVYRIYKNDSSDPAWTGDSDETVNDKDTTLPSGIVPPEIPDMVLVESRSNFGEVEVQIRPPYGSLEWSHADIYYQEEGQSDWNYAGQTKGESKKISGLRIGKEYDFKAISISPLGVANNNEVTKTITLTGDAEMFKPNAVSGIQLIGNKGSETNVYGSDFEFKWNRDSKLSGDDSTSNYIKHAGLSNIYENLRCRIAVYFPNIPTTVKHGSVQVRNKVAHEEIVTENHYRFRLAQNIEATKDLWKDYSTHASYSTYYGNPQRVCKFALQAINGYGNVSTISEITLTNPAPDMQDENGAVMTPEVKALKSAIRVKWTHPYKEYDISHFIVKYATDSNFTQNVKRIKVTSLINVDSSDADVEAASYKTEIDGLDPKKTYYIKVIPHDTYGAGTASNVASVAPGVSHDDDDDDIDIPGQIAGVSFSLQSSNNLKIKWTKSADIDIKRYIVDWRAVQFAGTPTLTLTSAGGNIPTLAEVEQGYLDSDNAKLTTGEKRNIDVNLDESESHTNDFTVIKNAKTGYTYFARVRAENTSGKKGAWSGWAYNTVAVEGLSTEDMPSKWAMYKFTGSVTAENATQITWVGGTGVLKKKTNAGSTDITINTQGTPQTVSGTKYLCYVGTANLALKTEAELDADSTYVAIAKCTAAPSGKCKVLMMVSAEHFRISAYEAGFNQLSAVTADVGEITAGTLTGTTIQTGTSNPKVIVDSSGLRAYNSSGTQRVQISSDGSGWLGSSGALYWDTAGNLTVTGVVADSVAAEDIVAGTITGSTLQTASSGKRFIVSTSSNEAEFYGEESTGGTVTKLATIGITGSAPDYYIGDFGTTSTTNTRAAIRARAYSNTAIVASSNSGTAVDATSSSGYGIFAYSASNYAISVTANSTKAHIHLGGLSSAPSTGSAGDIYYNSTDNKLYCHNGSGWQALY